MTKVDNLNFGSIVVNGKEYGYDVVVMPDGTVREREASKKRFGSHNISKAEIEVLVNTKPDAVVIGTGTSGVARVASDATTYAQENKVDLAVLPSPEAVDKLNRLADESKRVAALIHITC